jgi:hypothetical protein
MIWYALVRAVLHRITQDVFSLCIRIKWWTCVEVLNRLIPLIWIWGNLTTCVYEIIEMCRHLADPRPGNSLSNTHTNHKYTQSRLSLYIQVVYSVCPTCTDTLYSYMYVYQFIYKSIILSLERTSRGRGGGGSIQGVEWPSQTRGYDVSVYREWILLPVHHDHLLVQWSQRADHRVHVTLVQGMWAQVQYFDQQEINRKYFKGGGGGGGHRFIRQCSTTKYCSVHWRYEIWLSPFTIPNLPNQGPVRHYKWYTTLKVNTSTHAYCVRTQVLVWFDVLWLV